MKRRTEKAGRSGRTAGCAVELVIGCVLFAAAVVLYAACKWIHEVYGISFMELLFTLVSPLKGANLSMVFDAVRACIPEILLIVLFVLVCVWIWYVQGYVQVRMTLGFGRFRARFDLMKALRHMTALVSAAALLFACLYANRALEISDFILSYQTATTIYEDEYVDPRSITIKVPDKPKNLLYIYLESLETSYASQDAGGAQPVNNYIPFLTRLAEENCSFSNTEQLGGWRPNDLTAWTMATLFATATGIPMAFPVARNAMNARENFASGAVGLGELLEEQGYQNVFLCGSNAAFAGRDTFYNQHGDFIIYDLFSAREEGYIPQDYAVFWGYEDEKLYDIAQDKLTQLSRSGQPFNFTMLTVDTHYPDGYVCRLCGEDYPTDTENVIACADRQIEEFLGWCRQQDFYEDTVIVLVGDHPRMDSNLVSDMEFEDRTIYNCILNCGIGDARLTNREFSAVDMFPTVLAAMGWEIEGDRLGLGVNLFSDQPTLSESMGYLAFADELTKYSPYYIKHFS